MYDNLNEVKGGFTLILKEWDLGVLGQDFDNAHVCIVLKQTKREN